MSRWIEWSGVLLVLDVPATDGRILKMSDLPRPWKSLPLAIEFAYGAEVPVIVGRIEELGFELLGDPLHGQHWALTGKGMIDVGTLARSPGGATYAEDLWSGELVEVSAGTVGAEITGDPSMKDSVTVHGPWALSYIRIGPEAAWPRTVIRAETMHWGRT